MGETFAPKWAGWLAVGLAISAVVCAACVVLVLAEGASIVNVAIAGLILVLGVGLPLTFVWPGVRYTVREEAIEIRSGLFRWHVPLAEIERVTPSVRDWASGPAPSLDRIRIEYRAGTEWKHVLVSPQDRQGFLEAVVNRARHLQPSGEAWARSESVA